MTTNTVAGAEAEAVLLDADGTVLYRERATYAPGPDGWQMTGGEIHGNSTQRSAHE
jgi:hypothetical protein